VLEPCIHTPSKATERQNPCVVMKRTDSIYPVQSRARCEPLALCGVIIGSICWALQFPARSGSLDAGLTSSVD
jgi:hypothetical protein